MDADLRDLLAAYLNQAEFADERCAALRERLCNDAAFREAFTAEIRLLSMLEIVQAPEPRWLRLEDECGWSAAAAIGADDIADKVLSQLKRGTRRRWLVRSGLTAAVILTAASLLPFVHFRKPDDETSALLRREGLEVGAAVRVEQVQWAADSEIQPREGEAIARGRLRTESGKLMLAFFNGVILAVEGPADVEIRNADEVFCHYGKLRMRSPQGFAGFVVRARGVEIVDLGSEFGLNVKAGAAANLMLFEGQAALSVIGPNGQSVCSMLLDSFRSVEIDAAAAQIREIPNESGRYTRLLDTVEPVLDLPANYRDIIMSARPWGYWRFEGMVNGRIANEVAGRPSLLALGGVQLESKAVSNRWGIFRENDLSQAFLMDGVWTPPRHGGYALECWVQSEPHRQEMVGQNAVVSLIASRPGREENHMSLLELTARNGNGPLEPFAVRFLDRWPPAQAGGVNLFSRRNVLPTQWHHVVGQMINDTLELYMDGKLVATSPAPLNAGEGSQSCRLYVGRLKQNPLPHDLIQIRPFEGRIDELAVYEHGLSPDEIRQRAAARHAAAHPVE